MRLWTEAERVSWKQWVLAKDSVKSSEWKSKSVSSICWSSSRPLIPKVKIMSLSMRAEVFKSNKNEACWADEVFKLWSCLRRSVIYLGVDGLDLLGWNEGIGF